MAGYQDVVSVDGTRIAFRHGGEGSPLVLVHGTTGSDWSWRFMEPELSPHFTLYVMQRRGRGGSGDGPDYSISREAEDIAVAVDSVGGPVDLFGHSYGAACALEASLIAENLRKMVLYEPPIEVAYPPGSIDAQERLAAEGRYEELIESALSNDGVLSPEEWEALKASPTWSDRVSLAWTIPRESREESRFTLLQERFREIRVPTLVLLGSESGQAFRSSVERVLEVLPDVSVSILQGHGHAGIMTAPDVVAREVVRFLSP